MGGSAFGDMRYGHGWVHPGRVRSMGELSIVGGTINGASLEQESAEDDAETEGSWND